MDNSEVISWRPTEKQWWITGFNPDYVGNVDVSKEIYFEGECLS